MKTNFYFKKVTLLAVTAICIVSMNSCDNSDTPDVPSPADAYGSFNGKLAMYTETAGDDSLELKLKLKKDTIYFDSFSVDSVVVALEGPTVGGAIIDTLSDIAYKVGYEPKMSTAQDSVYMDLKPEPFTFKYNNGTEPKVVKVTVKPTEGRKSSYALTPKKLNFSLDVAEVSVNDEAVASFEPVHYGFAGAKE